MTEIITLRDCIDEAITLVSLDKKGKSMRYEVRCEPDIRIKGDSQRLLQVLLNLINNSRDASQPDGKIQMCCDEFGEWIRVVVEDEGVGISADVIDRVFDPLFTTKEAGKGTGLGLSLVYSKVEDLQGNIDIKSPAQSNPGRGTRVVLTFPGLKRVTDQRANVAHLEARTT
jgi:signal transduction histidine kinase